MSELANIARPYAKAAFEYAVENKAITRWQDMLGFMASVAQNDSMQQVLKSAMAANRLSQLFIDVCGDQLDPNGQNLIRVMAENGRLNTLPDVLAMFNQLKSEYDKEVTIEVTSATELSDKQIADLSASLEKRLARKVQLNCKVDPELVAGMVIQAGDNVIDGSIRSKLTRLADALQA